MDLTPKQKAFADEYIKNGGNAQAAAKAAGYSDTVAKNAKKISWKNVEFLNI